jgi:hypothetical protein
MWREAARELGKAMGMTFADVVDDALRTWVITEEAKRRQRPAPLPPPPDVARDGDGKGGPHTSFAENL